jgi:hypothetical protein
VGTLSPDIMNVPDSLEQLLNLEKIGKGEREKEEKYEKRDRKYKGHIEIDRGK